MTVPDDLGVRRLGADEFALLRRLRLAALADAPTMFLETSADAARHSDDEWRARAARHAKGTLSVCVLAHRGLESIGMVIGSLDAKDRSVARVYGMWVAPEARRGGAGARLLRAIRDWAIERRCTEIRLHVFHAGAGAQAFYRSQGFTAVAAAPDDRGFVEYAAGLPVA